MKVAQWVSKDFSFSFFFLFGLSLPVHRRQVCENSRAENAPGRRLLSDFSVHQVALTFQSPHDGRDLDICDDVLEKSRSDICPSGHILYYSYFIGLHPWRPWYLPGCGEPVSTFHPSFDIGRDHVPALGREPDTTTSRLAVKLLLEFGSQFSGINGETCSPFMKALKRRRCPGPDIPKLG